VTTTPPRKDVLGLGPLEAAIMAVVWRPDSPGWLDVRAISGRLDYPRPLSYTTVSTVAAVLCGKGLLARRRSGRRWHYQAARPRDEHIGHLIAALLDAAGDPPAALACALRHPVLPGTGHAATGSLVGAVPCQPASRAP
jgi:predicted transcriptional regulator